VRNRTCMSLHRVSVGQACGLPSQRFRAPEAASDALTLKYSK
jgi:hypothetical protein